MKYIIILIFTLFSLLNPTASAKNTWVNDNGKPVKNSEYQKEQNGFGAQLWVVEGKTFFEQWNSSQDPHISQVKNVRRNVPIYTVIIFADPGRSVAGIIDVKFDLKISKPDGTIYGEFKNLVAKYGYINDPKTNLMLSENRLAINIEASDPSGEYTVAVLVKDSIKSISLPLVQKFHVN